MTLKDMVDISAGNLWRMKLRTFLTVSGVLIAIAAFVAMLSFGAGNQKYITEEYNRLGLFNTMQVYTRQKTDDSSTAAPLNREAVARLARIPGVRLAYPFDAFSVKAAIGDTVFSSRAQVLPLTAAGTKLYADFAQGRGFESDSAREVILSREFALELAEKFGDSLLGQKFIITTTVPSLDSALAGLLTEERRAFWDRLKNVRFDSLVNADYRKSLLRREANELFRNFADGYFGHQAVLTDTLTVVGILDRHSMGRALAEPLLVSEKTARELNAGGFGIDPADIVSALQQGAFFYPDDYAAGKNYSRVTLDIDPYMTHDKIKDSVEAMGFRTFSFAEQFAEMKRFFLYFNLGLGIIGFIALLTASLGIANTMIMAIIERRREIGILKSLGADEREIKILFLAESGVIGLMGAVLGIIFGWAISRVVSLAVKIFMEKQGVEPFELFSLPLWLILTALFFGVMVSLLAGYYPASRAARVNPVEALRSE